MKTYEVPEIVELGDADRLTLDCPSGPPEDTCGLCLGGGGDSDQIIFA